jgi:membrane-associated protease RseP (regulator of RpoE activity)
MADNHGAISNEPAIDDDSAPNSTSLGFLTPLPELSAAQLRSRRLVRSGSAAHLGRSTLRRRRAGRRRAVRIATAVSVLALIVGVALVVDREGVRDERAIATVADPQDTFRHSNRNVVPSSRPARPAAKSTKSVTKRVKSKAVRSAAPSTKKTEAAAEPGKTTVGVAAPAGAPTAGVPAGTTLKSMNGALITKAGTVIDGAEIKGGVTVAADNVVIKRSRISGSGTYGVYVRSGSLTIQNSTISGFENSMAGDNYATSGLEVTASSDDGFKIGSNVSIVGSWCHDLATANGAHADCGQIQSGVKNVVIQGNWFDPGSSSANSALFIAPDLGPSGAGPLLVEGNVLGGGNYSLFCVDGDNGRFFISGITVRNNSFLRNSNYGPMRINVQAQVLGNVWKDTNSAVPAG